MTSTLVSEWVPFQSLTHILKSMDWLSCTLFFKQRVWRICRIQSIKDRGAPSFIWCVTHEDYLVMPFNGFVFPLLLFLYNGVELYKPKTIVQFSIQFNSNAKRLIIFRKGKTELCMATEIDHVKWLEKLHKYQKSLCGLCLQNSTKAHFCRILQEQQPACTKLHTSQSLVCSCIKSFHNAFSYRKNFSCLTRFIIL